MRWANKGPCGPTTTGSKVDFTDPVLVYEGILDRAALLWAHSILARSKNKGKHTQFGKNWSKKKELFKRLLMQIVI